MKSFLFPKSLKFLHPIDLIRVGRDFDGGYLISKHDLLKSEALVSFGISTDWSFESEFLKLNKVPIYAFDGSVSFFILLKQALSFFFKHGSLRNAYDYLLFSFRFLFFFRGERIHFKKFIGCKATDSNFLSLSEVLTKVDQDYFFLKIDIEGYEYELLDDILRFQDRISGMAIEFHNIETQQLIMIEKFVNALNLEIAHIHFNNFSDINSLGFPEVIELIFTRNCIKVGKDEFRLPHQLDMPCDPNSIDFVPSYPYFA